MKKIGVSLLAFSPMLALAQGFGEVDTFVGSISTFINSTLIPLVFGIALLVFLWGVFKFFILGGSDEGKRESGKQLMLYSVVGFVVMVSIFGIVNMISSVLPGDENIERIPNTPTGND